MPTRVRLSDGRVVVVQTDDPDAAARAAHRYQQNNPVSQQHPSWRARNVDDQLRGAPSRAYQRAYQRRAQERAPRERPGTLGRALEDFNRSGPAGAMDQMWRNLGVADEIAGGTTYLGQGAENLVRRVTGRDVEIPANEAANAAIDYERDQQQRVAREQPILNAASIAASVPALAGSPQALAPRLNMLQGGALAAGLNAPFAVSRQEGSLQERLPGAGQETAVVGAFGSTLTGAANRFLRPPAANSAASRAAEFEQAGVRPTLAAVAQGTPAAATRMITENFIAGAPARARVQASLDDTANAARNLSQRYGQHGQPEQVGEAVQRGVQRFASEADTPRPGVNASAAPESIPTRDWSFRAKSGALYDRVFDRIARDEAAHLAGQTGARATADNARQALQQIQARVAAPNVAEIVNDPQLGRIAQALADDADSLRFNDLRALRTWVREARSRPNLTQTIDEAALARLEQALTQDIYESAIIIGGRTAAQQLRRADQFYRAGQQRIQNALAAFAPVRNGVQQSGRAAYDRILSLAREGGRQNTRALQQLRSSLRPEEWREVAATIIDDMGRVTAGHPESLQAGAFSVERFATQYARLTPEGRRILFGGPATQQLANELDNLARVAGYQKGVEAMANRSRSGVNVQNFGSIAGLANPGTMAPTATLLAGMAVTGEMLTNPAFVRWLVSAPRAGASGGMRRHIAALAAIAARDPAVAPLYDQLARTVVDQLPPAGDRSPAQSSQQLERSQ